MTPAYSNEDTVALHVTRACNLRCAHCYQRRDAKGYRRDMDAGRAFAALDALRPAAVVLYGGEPLMRPELVRAALDRYPDTPFILHTNGTLDSPDRRDILDRVAGIYLTLESFLYERQPPARAMSRRCFERLRRFVDDWRPKIRIIHNLYPSGNDPAFYRMARLRGLDVASYPMISDSPDWEWCADLLRLPLLPPLTRPKLRVLEDGTITRDMRGAYNLCACDGWREELRGVELPVSETCRNCPRLAVCPACGMFPHFVRDELERRPDRVPGFCRLAAMVETRRPAPRRGEARP